MSCTTFGGTGTYVCTGCEVHVYITRHVLLSKSLVCKLINRGICVCVSRYIALSYLCVCFTKCTSIFFWFLANSSLSYVMKSGFFFRCPPPASLTDPMSTRTKKKKKNASPYRCFARWHLDWQAKAHRFLPPSPVILVL